MESHEAPRSSSKPDLIRSAAQRLFLQRGLRRTSMDAVAAEAGVTKQTVYRYFGSKEKLFVAVLKGLVVERVRPGIAAAPKAARSEGEFEDRLLAAASQILDRVLDPAYIDLVRVLVAEAREFPELTELFRTTAIEPMASVLTDLLGIAPSDRARHAGTVPPELRLFVAPLLNYELEAMLGDPAGVRERAHAELPELVKMIAAAIAGSTDTGGG